MNTVVISREAAGSRGQTSHLPTIRFRAGCRWTAAGLWLALALLASGISFAPGAVAQDASWQDDQQPRRRRVPRRRPTRTTNCPAANSQRATIRRRQWPPHGLERLSRRRVCRPAGKQPQQRAKRSPPATPSPRGRPSLRRAPAAAEEENSLLPGDLFRNPDEDGNEDDFGYHGPALREILSNRLWFRGEALLWWIRGGETPPLLTTSPGSTPLAQAGVLGQPGTTVLFGDQELNTGLHAGAACPSAFGWTVARNRDWNSPTWSWARTRNRTAARAWAIPFSPDRTTTCRPGPWRAQERPEFGRDCLSRLLQRHLQRESPPRTFKGPRPSGGTRSPMKATGGSISSPAIASSV